MAGADVLVVGAGIVGLACAASLTRRGLRVRVIDCRPPATGRATAAGMGHLVVIAESPALLALTRIGRALWERWAEDDPALAAAVEWDACGTIWVAEDREQLAAGAEMANAFHAAGVQAEVLDPAALRRAEPNLRDGLAGGVRVPGDRVLYPPAAARALLDARPATGTRAEFVRTAPVVAIGDGYARTADGTTLYAGAIVDAAGDQALALVPGLRLPGLAIRPRRGHLVITARHPGFCQHQLVELGYVAKAHGHGGSPASSVAFNVQPRRTGQLLIGSSREFDVTERRVDPGVVQRMLARAIGFMPALGGLTVVRAWTGIRAATPDHLPIVGRAPGLDRVWLACGHEGLGITTSLVTGELIAHGITGASLDASLAGALDPRDYAPDRHAGTERGAA